MEQMAERNAAGPVADDAPGAAEVRHGRMPAADETLLSVNGLGISFSKHGRTTHVTRDVSFSVARGERLGVVGESGCGKSVTGLALMGLLPSRGAHIDGEILFEGRDLARLTPRQMREVRGRDVSMIFQEPMSALDPVFSIGDQLSETLRTHFKTPRREARKQVIEALAEVGIPHPQRRVDEFPHHFSGGMRQRVMIAMALICRPKLIIADEPTTALDVTVQAQIMDLLCDVSESTGTALVLITHDLGVVAETCSRMLTMYAGEVVENAPVDEALRRPAHPYTSGLLQSLPRLSHRGSALPSIPGRVPSPQEMPEGCRFMDRCGFATTGCETYQPRRRVDDHHEVRCWRHSELSLRGATE